MVCYQSLVIEAEERGLLLLQAKIFNALGGIEMAWGNMGEAFDQFHRSLDLRRQLGDRRGAATVLRNLGSLHSHVGEYQEALLRLEEAWPRVKRQAICYAQGRACKSSAACT